MSLNIVAAEVAYSYKKLYWSDWVSTENQSAICFCRVPAAWIIAGEAVLQEKISAILTEVFFLTPKSDTLIFLHSIQTTVLTHIHLQAKPWNHTEPPMKDEMMQCFWMAEDMNYYVRSKYTFQQGIDEEIDAIKCRLRVITLIKALKLDPALEHSDKLDIHEVFGKSFYFYMDSLVVESVRSETPWYWGQDERVDYYQRIRFYVLRDRTLLVESARLVSDINGITGGSSSYYLSQDRGLHWQGIGSRFSFGSPNQKGWLGDEDKPTWP